MRDIVTQGYKRFDISKEDHHSQLILLGLILIVAGLVRFWGIDFCLPSLMGRPDEIRHFNIASNIAKGDLNPHFFRYPTLYFYLLGLLYKLLAVFTVMPLDTIIGNQASFFFLSGRIFSAVMGVLSVLAVFFLGRQLGKVNIGLVAAILFALNYSNVRDSHFMSVDATLCFFVTVSLSLLVKALKDEKTSTLIWAAVFAGLATSIKYNAVFLTVSVLIVHIFLTRRKKLHWTFLFRKTIWISAAIILAAFFLTSIYVVLDYPQFIKDFSSELNHFHSGWYPAERAFSAPVFYLIFILPYGFGVLPMFLSLLGIYLWIRHRKESGLMLLSFFSIYLLSILSAKTVFARYLLPLLPVFCVSAAVAFDACMNLIKSQSKRRFVSVLFVIVILFQPAWTIFNFNTLISKKDTRQLAEEWIKHNLKPGSILQIGGMRNQHWGLDRQTLSEFSLFNLDIRDQVEFVDIGCIKYQQTGGKYIVIHEYPLIYSTIRPEILQMLGRNGKKLICFLSYKQDNGFSSVYDYEDAFYLPYAGFKGIERPGPNICIYQLLP